MAGEAELYGWIGVRYLHGEIEAWVATPINCVHAEQNGPREGLGGLILDH